MKENNEGKKEENTCRKNIFSLSFYLSSNDNNNKTFTIVFSEQTEGSANDFRITYTIY